MLTFATSLLKLSFLYSYNLFFEQIKASTKAIFLFSIIDDATYSIVLLLFTIPFNDRIVFKSKITSFLIIYKTIMFPKK